MSQAYVGLGANTGNREANLRAALGGMTRLARVEAVSALYETAPEGPGEQPPFHNAACHIETGLEPASLLRFLQGLEHEIGRRRGGPRWGPRPIDIDILLYEDRVMETDALTIPHPRLAERAFVLVPLADIAPEARHPALGKTISELLATVATSGVRRIAVVGWDGVAGQSAPVRL